MFDIGPMEATIVVLAILLLFGAKRIPDLARSMGAGIREFRRAMNEISHEVQTATSLEPSPPPRPLAPSVPPPEDSQAIGAPAPPPPTEPLPVPPEAGAPAALSSEPSSEAPPRPPA
jgi:sec-independent protein translocase protein TatA